MRQNIFTGRRTKIYPCLYAATCFSMLASLGGLRAQEKELSIAAPEQLTLTTDDGVNLNAVWYAGGVAVDPDKKLRKIEGDKVVPLIILHGWGGSSRDFSAIASYLQTQGHAVLVPDLRGHGASKVMVPGRTGEREKPLDEFTRVDMGLMVTDLIRLKKFLLEKNNAKQVNIELLGVMASQESAIVAANWVVADWSYPDLLGGRKQGKDVAGLILLSPVRSYNGMHWNDAMRHPVFTGPMGFNAKMQAIPVLVITGTQDPKAYREAKTIYSRLETYRKRLHQMLKVDEDREKQTLFLVERETELQGWKLLDPRLRLNVHTQIAGFVDYKLARMASEYGFDGERRFRSAD